MLTSSTIKKLWLCLAILFFSGTGLIIYDGLAFPSGNMTNFGLSGVIILVISIPPTLILARYDRRSFDDKIVQESGN